MENSARYLPGYTGRVPFNQQSRGYTNNTGNANTLNYTAYVKSLRQSQGSESNAETIFNSRKDIYQQVILL